MKIPWKVVESCSNFGRALLSIYRNASLSTLPDVINFDPTGNFSSWSFCPNKFNQSFIDIQKPTTKLCPTAQPEPLLLYEINRGGR